MRIHPIFITVPAVLALPSAAWADITTPAEAPQRAAYHADLLASNAVHAVFKEIRSLPVVRLDAAPGTEEVAVFEVKQNLAHRRYDRMGDGALQTGKLFSVSLATDIPGQDAALADKLRGMKPGDEALLNMDHIYVFREEGNENVRACTRFAQVQPKQPEAPESAPQEQETPAAPSAPDATAEPPAAQDDTAMPLPLQPAFSAVGSSVESRITVEPDGLGGMKRMKIEVHREWGSNGEQRVRKFINDVEVDPQTDQPLGLSGTPVAAPLPSAPAAAPQQTPPPIPDPRPTSPTDSF